MLFAVGLGEIIAIYWAAQFHSTCSTWCTMVTNIVSPFSVGLNEFRRVFVAIEFVMLILPLSCATSQARF